MHATNDNTGIGQETFFPGDQEILDEEIASRMDARALQLATRMAFINSRHLGTKRDVVLDKELTLLAGGAVTAFDGHQYERRALVVIGETGAGKSTTIERAIKARPEYAPRVTGMTTTAPIICVTAPRPCSLKLMAEEILDALEYPIARELKMGQAWKLVRHQLKARGVRFLHIDEAQHLLNLANKDMMEQVSDALKTLMEQQDWPIYLILSGLPELADFMSLFRQLRRRSHTIHLDDLAFPRDERLLRWMVSAIVTEHAKMALAFEPDGDFLARLCHAADRQFGAVTQIVRGAIERVLMEDIDGAVVERRHFEKAYQVFSGCRGPDQNVMSARNWQEIDPMNALLREQELAYVRMLEAVEDRQGRLLGRRRRRRKEK